MDREAWCPVVHGFPKNRKWLGDWTELKPCLLLCGTLRTVVHQIPGCSLYPSICSDSWPLNTVIPSNHLIFCCLLVTSCFHCIRVLSLQLTLCIRWPKDWSFSRSPCSEYSVFISFKIDWFDLLALQGTLKSLLQQYSWKASTLHHSAFFMVPTFTSVSD